MTKKKETLPSRKFVAEEDVSSDRITASFTLTVALRGDVCSKEGLISELDECLSELAYNTNDGSEVKVETFELKMTEFKNL